MNANLSENKTLSESLIKKIQCIVEDRYDLGTVTSAKEILGGTVNTSFKVDIAGKRKKTETYFLREYNPLVKESEIRFEHALLNHLRRSGFELASIPIPARDGTTFFREQASSPDIQKDNFWALFDFLKGEDKYSWTYTELTAEECASSADILARLHHHGADFTKPAGTERAQPPIMRFLPALKRNFADFSQTDQKCRCVALFKPHSRQIQSIIDSGIDAGDRYKKLLKIPIHCDFHPGNLKFENGKGVGLFDFDWSKIDYRVFDVALALFYFTAQWRGQGAGCLRMDLFRLFLRNYQKTCARLGGIAPMADPELRALVPMLAYANLYVLNWSVVDFCNKNDADDDEYCIYIKHGIQVMQWIEDHADTLNEAISEDA